MPYTRTNRFICRQAGIRGTVRLNAIAFHWDADFFSQGGGRNLTAPMTLQSSARASVRSGDTGMGFIPATWLEFVGKDRMVNKYLRLRTPTPPRCTLGGVYVTYARFLYPDIVLIFYLKSVSFRGALCADFLMS